MSKLGSAMLGNGRIRGHDLVTMQRWGHRLGESDSHGMDLRVGDIMVLLRHGGDYTVRVITSVRTCRNPPDMQFYRYRPINDVAAMQADPRAPDVQAVADKLLQNRRALSKVDECKEEDCGRRPEMNGWCWEHEPTVRRKRIMSVDRLGA